jgi:hypothetical protein
MFTDREKWQAATRELGLRLRVYPSLVKSGRMTQQEADRQIALMDAMSDDYRDKVMSEVRADDCLQSNLSRGRRGHSGGCLHHKARDASLPEAAARCVHQPACVHVLGQSRSVNHDHDGGAGGVKGAGALSSRVIRRPPKLDTFSIQRPGRRAIKGPPSSFPSAVPAKRAQALLPQISGSLQ